MLNCDKMIEISLQIIYFISFSFTVYGRENWLQRIEASKTWLLDNVKMYIVMESFYVEEWIL